MLVLLVSPIRSTDPDKKVIRNKRLEQISLIGVNDVLVRELRDILPFSLYLQNENDKISDFHGFFVPYNGQSC